MHTYAASVLSCTTGRCFYTATLKQKIHKIKEEEEIDSRLGKNSVAGSQGGFVGAHTSAVTWRASKEPQQRNTIDWTDGPKQTAAGLMLLKSVYLMPDASKYIECIVTKYVYVWLTTSFWCFSNPSDVFLAIVNAWVSVCVCLWCSCN